MLQSAGQPVNQFTRALAAASNDSNAIKGALAKGLSFSSLKVSEEKGSISIMEEYRYMTTNPPKRIKMSDDERDIDVESEDENNGGENSLGSIDKRAHHNASERKRRDHIKEGFTGLREAIPTMKGGDKSSRAQILKKACDFIHYQRRTNSSNQSDMNNLKSQNDHLEAQIRALERAQLNSFVDKSAAELLHDEGLLAQGESLPTPYDLEPSVSGARAVAPGQSLLLKKRNVVPGDGGTAGAMAPPDFGRSDNPTIFMGTDYAHPTTTVTPGFSDHQMALNKCGFPTEENQSMLLLESHLDF